MVCPPQQSWHVCPCVCLHARWPPQGAKWPALRTKAERRVHREGGTANPGCLYQQWLLSRIEICFKLILKQEVINILFTSLRAYRHSSDTDRRINWEGGRGWRENFPDNRWPLQARACWGRKHLPSAPRAFLSGLWQKHSGWRFFFSKGHFGPLQRGKENEKPSCEE